MAQTAWIILLLPLIAWLIISLFGQRFSGQGDRISIGAVAIGFLLSLGVLWDVIRGTSLAYNFTWAVHGDRQFTLGYQVDQLTAMMLVIVTFVSLMVQVYSLGYMHGDVRYKRYYAVLSLFTFSMLGLVLADNLLFLFIFWELVGLSSFLLIGHWFEEKANVLAANKAFLTTRVGDISMFLGIMVAFALVGSFRFDELAIAIETGQISPAMLAVVAILIFGGAVGKSAQFPLHVWLPDAMAGPTPVSALIHAATMVAAGVYLVGRAFILFEPSPVALQTVAWVGAFTAVFAATMGLVMEDIKKVLAYSTVSQLGFMFAALGIGGYTAGLFHLMTHAFFKALLFLGSGSVIHALHTQNMHEMGGLVRKMPITAWTWFIGAAALAGIFPLAGFWSKDEILLDAYKDNPGIFWTLIVAATMTAFYIGRATFLTFFGKPRNKEAFEHAHEGPPSMTWPLLILAGLAAVAGLINSPVTNYAFAQFIFFRKPHVVEPNAFVVTMATLTWIVGLALAWTIYGAGVISHERLRQIFRPVWTLLNRRYYLDDAYHFVFVRGMVGLALVVGWFDFHVVDRIVNVVGYATRKVAEYTGEFDLTVVDGIVNGVAGAFVVAGRGLRRVQTGFVQSYVLVLFLSLLAGLAIALRYFA